MKKSHCCPPWVGWGEGEDPLLARGRARVDCCAIGKRSDAQPVRGKGRTDDG
jgi:hypothetical protein